MDFFVVVKLIQGFSSVPWTMAYDFRKIKMMLELFNFSICHVYREANRFTDFLANLGVRQQSY
ncbi:hypothetical protein LguiA_015920 [Lonicera macranthoides]